MSKYLTKTCVEESLTSPFIKSSSFGAKFHPVSKVLADCSLGFAADGSLMPGVKMDVKMPGLIGFKDAEMTLELDSARKSLKTNLAAKGPFPNLNSSTSLILTKNRVTRGMISVDYDGKYAAIGCAVAALQGAPTITNTLTVKVPKLSFKTGAKTVLTAVEKGEDENAFWRRASLVRAEFFASVTGKSFFVNCYAEDMLNRIGVHGVKMLTRSTRIVGDVCWDRKAKHAKKPDVSAVVAHRFASEGELSVRFNTANVLSAAFVQKLSANASATFAFHVDTNDLSSAGNHSAVFSLSLTD